MWGFKQARMGHWVRKQVFVGHHCAWKKCGEVERRVGLEGSAFSALVCPPDDEKDNMQVAD